MEIFGFDIMNLFTFSNLIAILIGTIVGLLIGALPGLGITIALVLLLPLSYMMTPMASILMLLAAFQSAEYGGSISAIILGIPGTPAAAATALDGYPMSKNESPGKALSYSLFSSTVGGLLGATVLMFLAIPLSKFALKVSDPEFFLLGILGLIGVSAISSRDKIKSVISVVLGLLVAMVGVDLFTGETRFTAGYPELMDGVNLVALIVGVFAVTEFFTMIGSLHEKTKKVEAVNLKGGLTFKEIKNTAKANTIGSLMGSLIGIFPGLGSSSASWFSYALAKKSSKTPEKFGNGSAEGIVAAEAANNSAVGGALLPLLTLGIPGSPGIAIIMGAFIIHGIQPGPSIFKGENNLAYGIILGFVLTCVAMYIAGRLLTPLFSRIVTVPNFALIPVVMILSVMGVYISSNMMFDVWLILFVGIVFFFLKKLEYSLPSFIIGFVLSPIIEVGLRRSLVLSDGSYTIFVTRPYSLCILIFILFLLAFSIYQSFRKNKIAPDLEVTE